MNKMYMSSSPRRERVREKKKRRAPVVVVGGGLYRVRYPHYINEGINENNAY